MRRIRDLMGLLVLAGVTMAGCETNRDQIRPPKPPEEYNAPPVNDNRYTSYPEFPRDVMEQDPLLKRAAKDASKTPGLMKQGGMSGPGGVGGRVGGP
ncbi:MAG: hypothetical protein U0840_13080 [Gemmataceae bacterium]